MTTRSAATLTRAFAAVRGLIYATGFVVLWWWVVASVRPLDSHVTLDLPAWLRVPGLILAVLGVLVVLSCVTVFALVGKGTPALRSTARVRRGRALLGAQPHVPGHRRGDLRSGLLSALARRHRRRAFFILLAHAFVLLYEEPSLEERFGESYLRYKKSVPRWLPRRPLTAVTMVLLRGLREHGRYQRTEHARRLEPERVGIEECQRIREQLGTRERAHAGAGGAPRFPRRLPADR